MPIVTQKSRWLWVFLTIAAIVLAMVGYRLLAVGYQLYPSNLSFSGEQAIEKAKAFQKQWFPEFKAERSAVEFVFDEQLDAYIRTRVEDPDFAPYEGPARRYWRVRLFTEGQDVELYLSYTTEGEPLSFEYQIPDFEPGAALSEAKARALAETQAAQFLSEGFDAYQPLATSSYRQVSGRLDYVFIYELEGAEIGDATPRLRLEVNGNQLVAVNQSIYLPTQFTFAFRESRSFNDRVLRSSFFLLTGLLGLVGLMGGGIWLYLKRDLIWRPALGPSLVIGTGLGFVVLGQLPTAWMDYQTDTSSLGFIFLHITTALGVMGLITALFTVFFATAEGLNRQAFPQHPRLYPYFRSEPASSFEIRNQVFIAYAVAGGGLLYGGAFSVWANQELGWWVPAPPGYDLASLTNWRPGLRIVFVSLQSAFWEESLYRAIPLSLAVIISRRLGYQRTLITFMLLLQAVLFAGLFSVYPQLPSYYRVIEFMIPGLVFGLLYLRFGLMLCILTHFLFGLGVSGALLFSLDTAGIWIDRSLLIGVAGLPLMILVQAHFRMGGSRPLANKWRNRSVSVGRKPLSARAREETLPLDAEGLALGRWWLIPLAFASLVLIIAEVNQPTAVPWPKFQISRNQAVSIASSLLEQNDIGLKGDWHQTVEVSPGRPDPRRFVWEQNGEEEFNRLLGTYLDTPYWVVIYRLFGKPGLENAEAWEFWLYPDGRVRKLAHRLAATQPGAHLSLDEATQIAEQAINQFSWADPRDLKQKAVEEIQQPARTDWSLIYSDSDAYAHQGAEAVVRIELAGDELSNYLRTIELPEYWTQRQKEQQERQRNFLFLAFGIGLVLLSIAISHFFFPLDAARRIFSLTNALPWLFVTVPGSLVVSLMSADAQIRHLDTTGSWTTQAGIMAFEWLLQAILIGVFVFLAIQAIHGERPNKRRPLKTIMFNGFCLALVFAGLDSLQSLVMQSVSTPTPPTAWYGSYQPWLTTIFSGFRAFIPALLQMLIAIGIARFTVSRKRWALTGALTAVLVLSASLASDQVYTAVYDNGLLAGMTLLMIVLIRRSQAGIALSAVLFWTALQQLEVANALYPAAWIHALTSFALSTLIAAGLVWHWYTHPAKTVPE